MPCQRRRATWEGSAHGGGSAHGVGLATDASSFTLSKGDATIRYASGADAATIRCPDLSTFIATSAQVANFNRCRGIACPPAR